jgi:ubiquinone/menaquinone biosynthesis C-methylase UbiE
MFLRKTRLERDPLSVTMSGVRLGERVLQVGAGDSRTIAMIAGKTGLTGTAAIVVPDDDVAVRIQRVVRQAGALVDLRVVANGTLPFDAAAFDAIVVHDPLHTILERSGGEISRWLLECRRVLRGGGRLVAIEPGTPVGLRSLFRGPSSTGRDAADTVNALRTAGFITVRVLGDREGLRFVEGLKTDD